MPNFLTGKLYNTHKNHERDIPRTQWHSKSLINDNITSPFHLILFLAMSHPILTKILWLFPPCYLSSSHNPFILINLIGWSLIFTLLAHISISTTISFKKILDFLLVIPRVLPYIMFINCTRCIFMHYKYRNDWKTFSIID